MNTRTLADIHRSIDKLEEKVSGLRRESQEQYDSAPPSASVTDARRLDNRGPGFLPPENSAGRLRPTIRDVMLNATRTPTIKLTKAHLLSQKIVTHDGADPRSRPYDMLRTQVSQAMSHNRWKVVGVTSPLPKCGKTLTAVNLAFSMARQPDQDILLADVDLRQPQIASYLGIVPVNGGVLDLLKQRIALETSVVPVSVGQRPVLILPTAGTENSSGLIGSNVMRCLLQEMRDRYPKYLIVLNLPPMLTSDDVLTILPQLDCVVLVAAVGSSKIGEVEECTKYLRSSQLLRVVVNKAKDNESYH